MLDYCDVEPKINCVTHHLTVSEIFEFQHLNNFRIQKNTTELERQTIKSI